MGIDPLNLNARQRELIDPRDRKALGLELPAETKRHKRMVRTLERDEQAKLIGWLKEVEDNGVLVYDWSRMDRKSTRRPGMPDISVYVKGRVLLGEMKLKPGTISDDQMQMMEKLRRSGTEVQIWYSAAEGIERIRDWLCALSS